LGHIPLEEKNAAALAKVASTILIDYGINDRVTYVVTDTTAVMPATVRAMDKKIWCPCWAHILNLMLGKILDALRPDFFDDLLDFVGGLSRTSAWRKLLARHGDFAQSSMPSFSRTRWYSLARLLQRVIKVWGTLQEYICDVLKKDPFSDAVFQKVSGFAQVVGTFANATASLEGDDFGTISRVYDWLLVIREKCHPLAEGWPALAQGLSEASFYWRQYLGANDAQHRGHGIVLSEAITLTDRVLAATFLNPASAYGRSLSPGNERQAIEFVRQSLALMEEPDVGLAPLGAVSEQGPRPQRRVSAGFTLQDLQVRSDDRAALNELDRFIAVDRSLLIRNEENFVILDWWNANRNAFPKLFHLAVHFLSLPATSAAIERQFSRAKKIHNPSRQSLAPPKVEAMVFLKEHLDFFDPLPSPAGTAGTDSESVGL
jgi:hypothetical protein